MKDITSIGEILFDVYPNGKSLGGAPLNFIYHVIKLTGNGNFISRIGADDLGKEIVNILDERQIPRLFLQEDRKHKTGEAITSLNDNKIPTFKIEEDRAYDFIELNETVENLLNNETECMYFGTLAQRSGTSANTIQSLFGKDIKYFCDLNIRQNFYTKEIIKSSLYASNVLKLNTDELNLISDLFFEKNMNVTETSKMILENFNLDLLCVTKGEEGAIIFNNSNESNSYNAHIKKEEIVDTVGAGDAFASILCLGYLKSWNIEKINKTAAEFAGEIVKVDGALPEDDSIYDEFKEIINDE